MLALPAPEYAITDEKVQCAVGKLVTASPRIPSGKPIGDRAEREFREKVQSYRDRPGASGPTPQIITQADVDREIEKRRAK